MTSYSRLFSNLDPITDEPPDHIENLHDQLEEHDDAMVLLSRISPRDAGWLAKHTQKCMELEREQMNDEIEKELQVCSLL